MATKELTPENVRFLVVHCADTPASMTKVDAATIDRWHRQKGWLRIGYHFVIKRDGTIQRDPDCRPLTVPGAHVQNHNHESLGICMVGGRAATGEGPENNFTPAQFRSLEAVLRELLVQFPKAEIVGHCDLNQYKACPSFDVKAWWASLPY